ncbi:PASTA domain-containing protein [Streptomyces acidiscabies]|uniref:PASTA domain-containing protein n=1 Tax=Streptomyces acidiscabies TaxID=42234 RepID=UPI0030D210AE
MHQRTVMTVLAVTGILALSACNPAASNSGSAKTSPAASAPGTPAPTDTAKTGSASAKAGTLPEMKGKGLQAAQDQAQAAGFYHLTSHDALGRGRMQAFDRNWKVCSQTPAAGGHPTDTKVDFAAVKLEESCPAKDEGAVQQAGATMPDFRGKSVKAARQALDSSTGITVKDVSGESRMILLESNWKVCTQTPKPGAKLDGQPVQFGAVKFGESC